MKHLFFIIPLFFSISCYSQVLKLDISLPQPRLGQDFYVSFPLDTLSKQIFNLPADKFKIYRYAASTGESTNISVNLEALKAGPNQIGPLTFTFNGHTYKTDVLKFTVADSLPKVDKGVWIRKVPLDDTTVYIMIDQFLTAHNTFSQTDPNSYTTSSKIDDDQKEVKLKTEDVVNAKVTEWGSSSTTEPDFSGKGMNHGTFYKCYKVNISDKSKPLVLTKKDFENLPNDYNFQNIVIN